MQKEEKEEEEEEIIRGSLSQQIDLFQDYQPMLSLNIILLQKRNVLPPAQNTIVIMNVI